MALHDELTGLPTRHLLEERARQALALADRRECNVGVLHLDLDAFGEVNERLGYSAGDRVLAEVARRLRGVLRSTDAAARVGGDDFAVVLTVVDGEDGIVAAIHRVLDEFRRPFLAGQDATELDCRIGAVLYPDHGEDPGELLAGARRALDRALAEDQRFVLFDPTVDPRPGPAAAARARSVKIEQLRQAVEADQLELHYQPVVSLDQARMVGAEALVRWRRSDGRILEAADFVPVAEHEGLIAELDGRVLEEAIRRLADWRSREDLEWISVNVAARTFHHGTIPERVSELLEEHGVRGSRLVLEVSESTALRNPEATRETARSLQSLGVGLALDDFGTGYSALAYLRPHPADLLKIDMRFVRRLSRDDDPEGNGQLVDAVIRLGHALGVEVVAKGVESEDEHGWLEASDCDYAQGFHLGRPVPADELFESPLAGSAAGSEG